MAVWQFLKPGYQILNNTWKQNNTQLITSVDIGMRRLNLSPWIPEGTQVIWGVCKQIFGDHSKVEV